MSDADGPIDATDIPETMHAADVVKAQQRADVVGAFYAQLMLWDDMDAEVALNLTVWEFHASGFADD